MSQLQIWTRIVCDQCQCVLEERWVDAFHLKEADAFLLLAEPVVLPPDCEKCRAALSASVQRLLETNDIHDARVAEERLEQQIEDANNHIDRED